LALLNFFKAKPVKKELSFSEPIFVKENLSLPRQIKQLETLKDLVIPDQVSEIEQDIKKLSSGLTGEKNVAYELKNSYLPLLILQDIYLKNDDANAQIDFIVIASFGIFVIECKNLFGNLEINNNGDFIRTIEYNGKKKKEGIYSPITQNERHLELIKLLLMSKQKGFISKRIAQKSFDTMFIPLVVLANPKTVVYDRYAKKEIKNKVIRADKLIQYIKDVYNKSDIAV